MYIGNQPVSGAFQKLDNISAGFNGTQTVFPLTSNSVAVVAGTSQNLIISISGVVQEPGVSYYVAGSTIVFNEAPLVTDSFFGILMGTVGEVPVSALASGTPGQLQYNDAGNLAAVSSGTTGQVLTSSGAGVAPAWSGLKTINSASITGTGDIALAALGANTFTGNQTGGDNKLIRWLAQDIGTVFLDRGTVGTGTVTFDYTGGSCQRLQVSGALTIALSNFPPSGNLGVIQLELVNAGSAAVTFPTINWVKIDGTFTTSISTYLTNVGRNALQTSGIDFIILWSRDGGTTVYGKIL